MRAIITTGAGSPTDVLQVGTLPKPDPADDQVRVRVLGSSLNASDLMSFRDAVERPDRGRPPLGARAMGAALRRANPVPGCDVAGVVEAVGPKVTTVAVGDEVYGVSVGLQGAWAEYAVVSEQEIAPKPASLSFTQAATVPAAGITALGAVRALGEVGGSRVLLNGSTGGVGLWALQLLVASGAEVTAVCSTRNGDLVRRLGAADVVDHTTTDVSALTEQYDGIIGIAGHQTLGTYHRLLAPGGIYVAVGGEMRQSIEGVALGGIRSLGSDRTLTAIGYPMLKPKHLDDLTALIEQEKIAPVVDRTWPLTQIAEAITSSILDHPSGKVALEVDLGKAD